MLGLAGERLRPRPGSRAARHALVEHGDTHTLGARWVALVTRVPALTVLVVTAGLLVMALPAKDLALGLPDNGTAPPGSTERVTYDLVAEAYGPGFNTPLLVTVDIIRTTDPIGVMDDLGRDLATLDGVEAVALTTPNRKADLGIVQVVPEAAQADPATAELAQEIRDRAGALEERYGVTDLTVTGHTAVSIDVSDAARGRPAAVRDRGGRALPGPARDRLPLGRGPGQGDARATCSRSAPPSARSRPSSSGAGSPTS